MHCCDWRFAHNVSPAGSGHTVPWPKAGRNVLHSTSNVIVQVVLARMGPLLNQQRENSPGGGSKKRCGPDAPRMPGQSYRIVKKCHAPRFPDGFLKIDTFYFRADWTLGAHQTSGT